MSAAVGAEVEHVFGLKAIRAVLGVSRSRLHELRCLPAGERPPIRWGHRGYFAVVSRLKDWMDSHDMDAEVYRELRRTKRVGAVMRGRAPASSGDSHAA